MEFSNPHFRHPVPYIIYTDFESVLVAKATADPSSINSFSNQTNMHLAYGYAYVVVGPDGNFHKRIKYYREENVVEHFLQYIIEEKDKLAEILTQIVPIQMTPQDEEEFSNATHFFLCRQPLYQDKCQDHNHLNG